MSDHERGAYSPQTDAPLAFDARHSQSGGGRGFPTTLVMSLVVLALMVVALVLFYRSGVKGSTDGAAPVGTPVAQIKAPAPEGSQPSDEAAGLQIYKTEGGIVVHPAGRADLRAAAGAASTAADRAAGLAQPGDGLARDGDGQARPPDRRDRRHPGSERRPDGQAGRD